MADFEMDMDIANKLEDMKLKDLRMYAQQNKLSGHSKYKQTNIKSYIIC